MKKKVILTLQFSIYLAFSIQIAIASTSIPIANPSFELEISTVNTWNWNDQAGTGSDVIEDWHYDYTAAAWPSDNDTGVFTTTAGASGDGTARVSFVRHSSGAAGNQVSGPWQDLGYTIIAGETYTFTMDIQRRQSGNAASLTLNYHDGGTRTEIVENLIDMTAQPNDIWATYSVSFTAVAGQPYVGKTLGIEFNNESSTDSWQHFDYARVEVSDDVSAHSPSPSHQQNDVDVHVDLSWVLPSGESCDVYFGTNSDARSNPKVISDQTVETYDPGVLDYNTTYYWAVDIVGQAEQGVTWSFTTESDNSTWRSVIVPVPDSVSGVSSHQISLNGDWKFTLTPPADFWQNSVDPSGWDDIVVPGEPWMQGFQIARDVEYPYKKTITIPADFANQTIFLQFDGVYTIGRVWVNGNFAGEHYGGFTTWQLDITPYVTPGQTAWITVGIMDVTDDISFASGYASRYYSSNFEHHIGGILRDVTLFAVPETHVTSLHYETDFDAGYNNADLTLSGSIQFNGTSQLGIDFTLTDPSGAVVPVAPNTISISDSAPDFSVTIPVTSPMKWDAEHPNLYTLTAQAKVGQTVTETITKKVGFREIKIDGLDFLVNGQPVKLRGGNRHSIHPIAGRAYVEDVVEQDVLLYKKANVNYVRTSHYPTSKRFLELADKYGLYIEEEMAIVWLDHHAANGILDGIASDPAYLPYFMSNISETVERDRDHPSIIIWSLGNENVQWGTNFEAERDYARAEDPTRPLKTGHNHYGGGWDTADYTDLDSYHYPTYNSTSDSVSGKPFIFDEYAHVLCYYDSDFDASRDPGVRNFWGESMKYFWETVYNKQGYLGGAIWGTIDDVFLAPNAANGYGRWGIFDGWRREKPEYWHTKKSHSPIRIENKLYTLPASGQPLQIDIANWFDHTNLNELDITWSTGTNSGIATISLAPGGTTGILDVHCDDLNMDDIVHLVFTYTRPELTYVVDEFNIRFQDTLETLTLSTSDAPAISQTATEITVSSTDFGITFSKTTGLITDGQYLGETIITGGPYLNLTPVDLLTFSLTSISANLVGNIAEVDIVGSYGSIDVWFSIQIDHLGTLVVDYGSSNISLTSNQEVGLSFILSDSVDQLSWDRDGLWSVYPDDHIGRSQGIAAKVRPGPELVYRDAPTWPWLLDMKDFHAEGKDHGGYGMTHDFRSQKEYIKTAAVANSQTGRGLRAVPGDAQHAVRMEYADPASGNIINNDDPGITYNGDWTYYAESGDYSGDEHYSNTSGDYAEFTFTGTYIGWLTAKNHNLGYADVYIDDVLVAQDIDCYNGSKLYQQVLFEQSDLADTTHTIRIVVTGNKNPQASGVYLLIDAFILTPLGHSQQDLVMHLNRHWEYNLGWGNYSRTDDPAANYRDQVTFGFVSMPQFTSDPVVEINAVEDRAYVATLADNAVGNDLVFTKVSGPTWLNVASNGDLAGTPTNDNAGLINEFVVSVTNPSGPDDHATLNINVLNLFDGQLGLVDFAGLAEHWLETDCGHCSGADLTSDGRVNLDDLVLLGQMWLTGF